jgi:ADP-heptose:LPS heptosyltransferase
MTWSPPQKPKILLIKLRSIGDVIYNTVVYSPIKKAWPDAHLTVVVEPPSYDIVRYHPDIDRVLVFDKKTIQKQIKFYWKLLAERYDIAIDMHEGPRGAGMCFLSCAPFKIGNKFAPRSFVYNTKIDFSDLKPKHPIDYQVALIKKLGVAIDKIQPDIYVPQDIHDQADRLLKEKGVLDPFCIIHTGARLHDQWQLQKFADLVDIISQRYGLKIILTCGPDQESEVHEILRKIKNATCIFIQTGLNELAAITKRANFVICHNGGYMHLASAIGTPIVALFGSSNPNIWSPLGNNHVILQHTVSKSNQKDSLDKRPNYKEHITVEEVLDGVDQVLGNSKN